MHWAVGAVGKVGAKIEKRRKIRFTADFKAWYSESALLLRRTREHHYLLCIDCNTCYSISFPQSLHSGKICSHFHSRLSFEMQTKRIATIFLRRYPQFVFSNILVCSRNLQCASEYKLLRISMLNKLQNLSRRGRVTSFVCEKKKQGQILWNDKLRLKKKIIKNRFCIYICMEGFAELKMQETFFESRHVICKLRPHLRLFV